MKRLEYKRETERNETFELILFDKSVGPQAPGQRAAMQCVMSAGEGADRGAERGRASARGWGSRFLRTDRLVDEYQFKRFVSCWYSNCFILLVVSYFFVSFRFVSFRTVSFFLPFRFA